MDKVEKDGKVAVLVSPGYGAGWSSWNSGHRDVLLFDADIVNAVLAGDLKKAEAVAAAKVGSTDGRPNAYLGGADQLEVQWVSKGVAFEIEEYDGYESLHEIGSRDYAVA